MLRSSFIALSLVGLLASSAQAATIVDAAVATMDLSTLVAAVQAADLVGTLNSAGPFTVLAPTNAAFAKLPKGTVKSLLKPENKAALTKVLTCHVISGEVMAKDVLALVKKGKGKAKVETVGGCVLKLQVGKGKIHITDENGRTGQVAAANLVQSNGVVHVINKVILPK